MATTPIIDPNDPTKTVAPAPVQPPSIVQAAQDFANQNKVTPLTNDFDESKSTAARVNDITSSNSPLMQSAATSGTQLAASRGLTNSSIAAQAAQKAVIDSATPIAQTDASLYSQNSLANLAAKNQAAVTNATNADQLGGTALTLQNSNTQQDKSLAQQASQFDTQAKQTQQQIDAQISQFAQNLGLSTAQLQLNRDQLTSTQQQALATLENQRAIAAIQSDTSKAVAQLNGDNAFKVAQLEASNKEDIQSSTNIASAWSGTMTNIANIQNNPNLDNNTKATLIQNNMDSFQAFADFWKKNTGTGAADVTPLLNFQIQSPGNPATTPSAGESGGSNGYGQEVSPGGGG